MPTAMESSTKIIIIIIIIISFLSFFSHSSLRHGSETNVGGAVNPDLHKLKNSKEKPPPPIS
jgi:hypothetical protein